MGRVIVSRPRRGRRHPERTASSPSLDLPPSRSPASPPAPSMGRDHLVLHGQSLPHEDLRPAGMRKIGASRLLRPRLRCPIVRSRLPPPCRGHSRHSSDFGCRVIRGPRSRESSLFEPNSERCPMATPPRSFSPRRPSVPSSPVLIPFVVVVRGRPGRHPPPSRRPWLLFLRGAVRDPARLFGLALLLCHPRLVQ